MLTAACAEAVFAYRSQPFFTELVDRAGLRAEELGEEESFSRIPLTTKADYRRGFPARVVNTDELTDPELVFTSRSSGTTGERLITLVHRHLLAERMASTVALNPAIGDVVFGRDSRRVARLAAPNCSDVECATPFTTMRDRVLPDGTLVLPVAHDVLATPPAMVDRIIAELTEYQPAWLYADPTHLAFLCEKLTERGISGLPGAAVVLTYSLCAAPALRAISRVLPRGLPVAEVLSMSEFGWFGMQCPYGRRHLDQENFYFEFLGTPAEKPGEPSELVITSIGDRLCPHIRYRTGDLVERSGTACGCGAPGPVVVHHGRASSCLRAGNRIVTARTVDDALADVPDIRFYRVGQAGPAAARCRVMTGDCDQAKVACQVSERLHELVPSLRVTVDVVTHIEAERSGKFSYCGVSGGESGT